MNETTKQQLLDAFAAYLDEAAEPESQESEEPDDYSLMAQLVALKTEVKTEARQFREALEQFRQVFATLQAGQTTLSGELEHRRTEEKRRERELLRPLLLQLADLHDRLEAGLEVISRPAARRPWYALGCKEDETFRTSLKEGQKLSLRRLTDILQNQGARTFPAEGLPLDPHVMRVTETESRPELPEGTVTAELRKGFFWGDTLLRPAEVRVNRHK